jgi:Gpi18-like mannosyltransferase
MRIKKIAKNWLPKNFLEIVFVFLLTSFIFYGYAAFISPSGMHKIYRSWDGPAYVVIAKSFYNKTIIPSVNTLKLPSTYFAAHFPLYPVFIRLFSFLGYFQASIIVSQLFTLLFIFAFYKLFKEIFPQINCRWLYLPLIFFTPRWFAVSHVGSSEPLFLFLITLTLYYLIKNKFLTSAIFAALAQLTRPQGILLFAGIFIYYCYTALKENKLRTKLKKFAPFLLVPITLLTIFIFYYFRYGDFLAFFNAIKNFNHMKFPPYMTFTRLGQNAWKEGYIFLYMIFFGTLALLWEQKKYLFLSIATMFYLPLIFLVHLDIGRYAIPLLPFTFIAYHKLITDKKFLIILASVIPAIIMYAYSFSILNVSP